MVNRRSGEGRCLTVEIRIIMWMQLGVAVLSICVAIVLAA